MKRTPGYLLQPIAGTYFLLPYGQLIADQKRGISLNETGVYIWEQLEAEPSREELRREYLKRFQTQPGQEDELGRDLDGFLDRLTGLGLIEDGAPVRTGGGEPCAYLKIGGLTLSMHCPRRLIDAYGLKDFCTDVPDHIDQRVRMFFGPPPRRANGLVLVRDRELVVCERETDYLLIFPTLSRLREVSVSKDGADAVFYCDPPVDERLEYQFFLALRLTFLYLAQTRRMYAIHSASILYRDRAWLFSAPSGTGKSTHVKLWEELYQTAVLNGDLNLLAVEDGRPVVHGIPWCGTSQTFDTRTLPLGGIVLLRRAGQDAVEELPPEQKALLVLQRFISPLWTAPLLEEAARFAGQVAGEIAICRLRCTKNPSAATVSKKWTDNVLALGAIQRKI